MGITGRPEKGVHDEKCEKKKEKKDKVGDYC